MYSAVRLGLPAYGRQGRWESAAVALIAVPWEGGVSFRRGTAQAPELIRQVSEQIDYYRSECPSLEEQEFFWSAPAQPFGISDNPDHLYEGEVLPYVESQVREVLQSGKSFGLIGGDHSIPLGAHYQLRGLSYGVLHIDAHADLRPTYGGMKYSHATILYHISQLPAVERIVAVGIRDWSRMEAEYASSLFPRLVVYEMRYLARAAFRGRSWTELVSEIVSLLPTSVYISIDMDVLEVGHVPHTGTPVPGGLRYEELFFLLEAIPHSGRRIIGFDVCETGGAELDAIVASHLIYRLCGLVLCGSDWA